MREPSPGIWQEHSKTPRGGFIGKLSMTREFYHAQIYEPCAEVDWVIDADAVDLAGASIMGYGWKPKSPGDLVRVKVVVPAWSAEPTSVVAALFVNQSVVPTKLASQELAPGKVGEAVLEFEMLAANTEAIELEVRVGPGRPGVIYLNGNENGPNPDMPKPTLTIEEYRPSRILPVCTGLTSLIAIYYLTVNAWKAALIGAFVGGSAMLGYGARWVLIGSFAIAVLAIAVALGLPPPDQWLQLAHDAQEAILAFRTSR